MSHGVCIYDYLFFVVGVDWLAGLLLLLWLVLVDFHLDLLDWLLAVQTKSYIDELLKCSSEVLGLIDVET